MFKWHYNTPQKEWRRNRLRRTGRPDYCSFTAAFFLTLERYDQYIAITEPAAAASNNTLDVIAFCKGTDK